MVEETEPRKFRPSPLLLDMKYE